MCKHVSIGFPFPNWNIRVNLLRNVDPFVWSSIKDTIIANYIDNYENMYHISTHMTVIYNGHIVIFILEYGRLDEIQSIAMAILYVS